MITLDSAADNATPMVDFGAGDDSFFVNDAYDLARSQLLAGIDRGRPWLLLTGQPGTGKTLLLQRVVEAAPRIEPHYFSAARHAVKTLPGIVRERLENLPRAATEDPVTRLIVIDDAEQATNAELFRLIEVVRNARTEHRSLSLLLCGDGELETRLANHPCANGMVKTRLLPLGDTDVAVFILCQLKAMPQLDDRILSGVAIERVAHYAGGIPAKINALCAHAIMLALQAGLRQVAPPTVDLAASQLGFNECVAEAPDTDTDLDEGSRRRPAPWQSADSRSSEQYETAGRQKGAEVLSIMASRSRIRRRQPPNPVPLLAAVSLALAVPAVTWWSLPDSDRRTSNRPNPPPVEAARPTTDPAHSEIAVTTPIELPNPTGNSFVKTDNTQGNKSSQLAKVGDGKNPRDGVEPDASGAIKARAHSRGPSLPSGVNPGPNLAVGAPRDPDAGVRKSGAPAEQETKVAFSPTPPTGSKLSWATAERNSMRSLKSMDIPRQRQPAVPLHQPERTTPVAADASGKSAMLNAAPVAVATPEPHATARDPSAAIAAIDDKPTVTAAAESDISQFPAAQLIERGWSAYTKRALTTPAHDNAVKWARQVLEHDPTSADAQEILLTVIDTYLVWADQSLASGSWNSAARFIDKARSLSAYAAVAQIEELQRIDRELAAAHSRRVASGTRVTPRASSDRAGLNDSQIQQQAPTLTLEDAVISGQTWQGAVTDWHKTHRGKGSPQR